MMTPFSPQRTYGFFDLRASRIGRVKMWVHYPLFHKWVSPFLPHPLRRALYERSRRWLYGPNANNEDLRELLRSFPTPTPRER